MSKSRPGTGYTSYTFGNERPKRTVIRASTTDSRTFVTPRGISVYRYHIPQAVVYKPAPKLYKPTLEISNDFVPCSFNPATLSKQEEDEQIQYDEPLDTGNTESIPTAEIREETQVVSESGDDFSSAEADQLRPTTAYSIRPRQHPRTQTASTTRSHRVSVVAAAAKYSQKNLFKELPKQTREVGISIDNATEWLAVSRFNAMVMEEKEDAEERDMLGANDVVITGPAQLSRRSLNTARSMRRSTAIKDHFPLPTTRPMTSSTQRTTRDSLASADVRASAARNSVNMRASSAGRSIHTSVSRVSAFDTPPPQTTTGASIHHRATHAPEADMDLNWQRARSNQLSSRKMRNDVDRNGQAWGAHNKRMIEIGLWRAEGKVRGTASEHPPSQTFRTPSAIDQERGRMETPAETLTGDGEVTDRRQYSERESREKRVYRPHEPLKYRVSRNTLNELSTEEGGTGTATSRLDVTIVEQKSPLGTTREAPHNSPILRSLHPSRRNDITNPNSVLFHPPDTRPVKSSGGVSLRSPLFNRTQHRDPTTQHQKTSERNWNDDMRSSLVNDVLGGTRRQADDEDSISEESDWSTVTGAEKKEDDNDLLF
ncbi:hypothetical protein BLNAU_907 [Blattamonas nauphoetae]|uniref:Uncharacterized protein n=1 Tax=Blattamonas nauphoetae TaxID=2049346 RepID=A0ABQ9YKU2_9EUKA|nr:hypothetical protein BLNAU_907 [Blattamonas nauphoetae]